MKFQCHTRDFLEAVGLVSGVVPANPTRPVLQSAMLVADQKGLQVIGTDLEVGLQAQVDEVMVEKEGSCLVPCARLVKILRELQGSDLSVEQDEAGQICIQSGSARFKVPAGPVDEYPAVQFSNEGPAFQIHREDLIRNLQRVSVASAKDATRFNMHSVLMEGVGEELRIVGTDGKRMAMSAMPVAAGNDSGMPEGQFIIPLKAVDLLSRILSSEVEENVVLRLDANEATYISETVCLSCRLVEGRFPEYERAIPQNLENVYRVNSEELLVALKQCALMTTKERNSVRFSFGDTEATLFGHASNVGESRIQFPVEKVSGNEEEFAVHFNPLYLIDLLRVIDSKQVECGFRDGKTAGLFSIPDHPEAYRHIVMPLVINEMQEA
ncbi:DNA polymerase III subunit beta [bacterium TMED181]|nr:DNA polymerase III subunit beta [Planctomycetota bacterium]OUW47402.1 MAG: DNA polymerase III subunit beta [bacterium TMED181]